jgi:hypothetical protein
LRFFGHRKATIKAERPLCQTPRILGLATLLGGARPEKVGPLDPAEELRPG